MSGNDIPFTEEDLHDLYSWVDSIPISRPKKNIARDFSDGCSVAEILHHFFPKIVELHNYVPSMAKARKIANWETLNARVLGKLFFTVSQDEMEDLVAAVPGAIERFLRSLRIKISQIKAHQEAILQHQSLGIKESMNHSGSSPKSSVALLKPKMAVPSSSAGAYTKDGSNPDRLRADRPVSSLIASTEGMLRDTGLSTSRSMPSSRIPARHRNPVSRKTTDDGDDDDDAVGNTNSTHHVINRKKGPGRLPYNEGKKSQPSPSYDEQLLDEKGRTIAELKETVSILSEKVMKLEELLHIKEKKLNQYRTAYGRI